MTSVLLLIALFVTVGAAIFLVVQRGHEIRWLAERGQPVRGRVVGRRSDHSKSTAGRHRRVKLAYDAPDGAMHERWISVTRSQWDGLEEGTPVELVYLPERPSVFAMRSLVNHARVAKNLPPLE